MLGDKGNGVREQEWCGMLGDKGNGVREQEWCGMLGDKGNGVAGNMMSINNISILVVGVLGTTRMLMLVIFKRLGATGWSLCPRTKPDLWLTP